MSPPTLIVMSLVLMIRSMLMVEAASEAEGCGPLCTNYGNCNLDTNSCECHFTHGGKDCNKHLAPACVEVEETEFLDPRFMYGEIRSCECMHQIVDLVTVDIPGHGKAAPELFSDNVWFRCFRRLGVPVELQNSTWPKTHEKVTWHRIINHQSLMIEQNVTLEEALAYDRVTMVPPDSTIVDGFRGHRTCKKWQGKDDVVCDCKPGYTGPDCDQVDDRLCPLGCSDNGICKASFCHCKPGFFGSSCSRNQTFLTSTTEGRSDNRYSAWTNFKIFVYELPHLLGYGPGYDPTYQADKEFYRMLLKDPIRTQNPWEASLFYVPDNGYATGSHTGRWWPQQHRVFRYLSNSYPFWDHTNGTDHFHFISRDRGACELELPRDAPIMNPIKVTYFGYHSHNGSKGWNRWGFDHAHAESCFRPMRDIVVPPNWPTFNEWSERYKNLPTNATRDIFFFFKGNPGHGFAGYSGGVRQKVAEALANISDPDIWFNALEKHKEVSYEAAFLRSVFCLAPYGQGWGVRLELALASGCIPVIIQDHVVQPFEPTIPYTDFSIRLPSTEIPSLIKFLRSVSKEDVQRLQEGGRRWHNVFNWQAGGEAYNYTIAALKAHWSLLRGEIEKRRQSW